MKKHLFSVVLVLLVLQAMAKDTKSDSKNENVKENDKTTGEHAEHHHPAKHWGYRNQDKSILPKDWHKTHPQCYGTQQSPINIEPLKALVDETLEQVMITSQPLGENNQEVWEMQNNGHSVVLYPKSHKFGFVAEGQHHELLQMHFHWRGSEHFIGGHRFAAELHLVHKNLNNSNKFAVIGFLFDQSNDDNQQLKPIVNSLSDIIPYSMKSRIDKLSLADLIPFGVNKYYRYPGSLTTPGCDEVVEWYVVDTPILKISNDQILDFQSIEDQNGYPMLTNSRPIQEINQRYVRKSFLSGTGSLRISNNRAAAFGEDENASIHISPTVGLRSQLLAVLIATLLMHYRLEIIF